MRDKQAFSVEVGRGDLKPFSPLRNPNDSVWRHGGSQGPHLTFNFSMPNLALTSLPELLLSLSFTLCENFISTPVHISFILLIKKVFWYDYSASYFQRTWVCHLCISSSPQWGYDYLCCEYTNHIHLTR